MVAAMELPQELVEQIATWDRLSRWERSEVGRDLRRLGLSYTEIQTRIEVKKSTLATWCRDLVLTDDQKGAILARTGSRQGIPVDTNWRRRAEIELIRANARQEARELMNDPFWVAGVVMYWAEGSKTRNDLSLVNSDPLALRIFINWIRGYLRPNPLFTLQLHLHEGNDDRAAQDWWRCALDLRSARFNKTFIKPPERVIERTISSMVSAGSEWANRRIPGTA